MDEMPSNAEIALLAREVTRLRRIVVCGFAGLAILLFIIGDTPLRARGEIIGLLFEIAGILLLVIGPFLAIRGAFKDRREIMRLRSHLSDLKGSREREGRQPTGGGD